MPLLDFPAGPSVGQQFTVGYQTWQWDGLAWRLVPTSSISTTSRVACNANTPTVTANVDVLATGCTTALNLTGGDKVLAIGTWDITCNGTTLGSSFVGSLYAGITGSTTAQAGNALVVIATPNTTDRQVISQSWIYTVPSTGNYTFALFGKHQTGSAAFTMYTPHTTLSVVAFR